MGSSIGVFSPMSTSLSWPLSPDVNARSSSGQLPERLSVFSEIKRGERRISSGQSSFFPGKPVSKKKISE